MVLSYPNIFRGDLFILIDADCKGTKVCTPYVNMALGAFTRVNGKTDWREGEQIHSTLDLLFTPWAISSHSPGLCGKASSSDDACLHRGVISLWACGRSRFLSSIKSWETCKFEEGHSHPKQDLTPTERHRLSRNKLKKAEFVQC